MKFKLRIFGLILFVLCLLNYNAFKLFTESYATNSNLTIETCELLKVVDGDTLLVDIDGKEEYVRLLNIDTPESVNPDESKNTAEGVLAANYTRHLLKNYKILYLTKDTNDRDKYERLLRLVWLGVPLNDSKEELENKCLNAILVKNKVAKVVVYDDYRYYEIFKEIENR